MGNNKRLAIKNFTIQIKDANQTHNVSREKVVIYLGFKFDYLLRLNEYVYTQLSKAKAVFRKHSNLFFNKTLSHRAKVICYLLLVRPIMTYAAPVWWNIRASIMEKLRRFERQCLRASLYTYRRDFNKHFVSNKSLYDNAGIPRVDNFIIKLTRDYFASLKRSNNPIIYELGKIDIDECIRGAVNGYMGPQAFMYFDAKGMIQDENNIPVMYHASRHCTNKTNNEEMLEPSSLKYSISIPQCDTCDKHKTSKKYWWLADDQRKWDEFRRRRKEKRHRVAARPSLPASGNTCCD